MPPYHEYFAVHRFNMERYGFSHDERPRLTGWQDVVSLFLWFGLAAFILSFPREGSGRYSTQPADGLTNLLSIFFIGMALWVLVDFFRKWWLATTGKILDGKIIDAWLEFKVGKGAYYRLHVSYGFKSPAGIIITGKTSIVRNDLVGAKMPPSGTPIKVLYKNDHYHKAV